MSKVQKERLQSAMTNAAAEMRRQGFKTKVHSSPLVDKIAAKMKMGNSIKSIGNWHEECRKENPELPKLTIPSLTTFKEKHLEKYLEENPQAMQSMPEFEKFVKGYEEIYQKHSYDSYDAMLYLAKVALDKVELVEEAEKKLPKFVFTNASKSARQQAFEFACKVYDEETKNGVRDAVKQPVNIHVGDVNNYDSFEELSKENPEEAAKQIIETAEFIREYNERKEKKVSTRRTELPKDGKQDINRNDEQSSGVQK